MASLRERILTQIEANFGKVSAGTDGYTITWNTIERKEIENYEKTMGNAIGIVEGTELNTEEVQQSRKTLEVFTEFWVRSQLGDDRSKQANEALLDVQRIMRTNQRLIEDGTNTQLVIDIREARNELDLEQRDTFGGVVVWEVIFRHSQTDPREIGPGH